jgi:hypothetical protein
LASIAYAAEVTGKWSGSAAVQTPDGPKDATAAFVLKQSGAEVTGTAGPNAERQAPIQNGKIADGKMTFELATPDGAVIKFDLTVDGDRMKGEANAEASGQRMNIKLDLKRD